MTLRNRENIVVSDAIKYVVARFNLDNDWQNKSITAIFQNSKRSGKPIVQLLGTDEKLNANECYIPHEVLIRGTLSVSVYSTSEDGRQTTNIVTKQVECSGYAEGETPEEPTPDVYAQIIEKLQEIEGMIDETAITKVVEEYLKEHPIQIDTYTKAEINDKISTAVEEIRKIIPTVKDGKSAYQIAVDNGFVGTEQEWLTSLKGEQGVHGVQGIPGIKGDKGDTGERGPQGEQGLKGDTYTLTEQDKQDIAGLVPQYDDTEINKEISRLNESIAEIESNELYHEFTTSGNNAFKYHWEVGHTYLIKNESTSSQMNVRTRKDTSPGINIEIVASGLIAGGFVKFTPTIDANVVYVYINGSGAIRITDISAVGYRLNNVEKNKYNSSGGMIYNPNLFGSRDNACVTNVNTDGKSAEINGFVKPSDIADYPSRDVVCSYVHINNQIRQIDTARLVDATSVTLNVGTDMSKYHVGSIIDLYGTTLEQNDKWSGQVTSVDGYVVTVSGWFAVGNKDDGQVPTGTKVICDPQTSIFGENIVCQLDKSALAKNVIGLEVDILNRADKASARGVDVIFKQGKGTYGFRAKRSLMNSNTIDYGFYAQDCDTGYFSENSNSVGFLAEGFTESNYSFLARRRDTKRVNFAVTGDGYTRCYTPYMKHFTSDGEIEDEPYPMYIIDGNYTVTIAPMKSRMFKVFSTTSGAKINATLITSNGTITMLELEKLKEYTFVAEAGGNIYLVK